jgi:calcium-dependent protein kinase
VFKVKHIPSGKFYAGKTISWASLEDKATSLAEIEAMKQLDHPNLIKLFEYFEMDDAKVMLIMEYLSGENLYERILEHEIFEEDYARKMFE